MSLKIKVTLYDGTVIEVKHGTSLMEISRMTEHKQKYPIIGALVDNNVRDLWDEPRTDCNVRFIDRSHPDGCRMMIRGYTMLLVKAVHDLFGSRQMKVMHSLSSGLFCKWEDGALVKKTERLAIEKRMKELVELDHRLERREMSKEEGINLFSEAGMKDKVNLLKFRRKKEMSVYSCNGYTDYFFGRLPPSLGYLDLFELRYYAPGVILRYPCNTHPQSIPPYKEQRKLARIYGEYKRWAEILEVSDAASLNSIIMEGEINDLIRIQEAFHEKKIARVADIIHQQEDHVKLILIAGPSSSGKTTFAQRLKIQLRVNGLHPLTISLDDYFVDKTRTPLDEDGSYDFDHIDAIDIAFFNEQLQALLMGEEVWLPRYDFIHGHRIEKHRKMKLHDKNILIVEGIHGLNERLTETVPPENKYKIYVSALTMLNLDDHNRIPTTDTRIIRRIVRDSQFRNHTATETINQWPMVRRGEEKFIFPYQEEADEMFNSALIYELSVLKSYVEPLLREIPQSDPAYAEARRLLSFTQNFLEVGTDEIPPNSILREFIGATCFFKMNVI